MDRPVDLRYLLACGAGLLVVLAALRLLPADGPWLALRLLAATAAVLLFPGAVALRVLGRRPGLPVGVGTGAAVAWSLVLVLAGQAVALLLSASLVTTGATIAVLVLVLLVVSARRDGLGGRRPWLDGQDAWRAGSRDRLAVLATVALGAVVGAGIWWSRLPVLGDALEHLSRTRKLAELPSFDRVGVSELFADATLHPGYAMPLWHTAMALVARLAGVDSAVVVQLAPAVLSPLVLVMVLGLGVALFRSRGAGLATAAGQLWLFGLANAGIGAFAILTGPATFSLLGLVPALLALAFTHLRSGRRVDLLSVAAAALVLTVVHPTYTIYAWLLLAAYGCARWLLADRSGTDLRRLGAVLAAAGAAAGLYLAWLAPVIASQPTVSPDAGEVERQLRVYAYQLDVHGSSYAMNPESLTRGGPATVLALAGLVVALLARRRRWAAFLLGASAVVLLITLVPALFTTVSDLVSISQARRIAAFLPAAVAVAAVAMVVGRLRVVGVVVGLGVGWALHERYPGDFTYSMSQGGGPAWPVWLAAAVCLVAAAVLPWLRRRPGRGLRLGPGVWGAAVAIALLVPSGVSGFDELKRHEPRTGQLTVGTLRALRDITPGEVVFADDRAAYDVAGYAPLYVNTAVEGHVWDRWQQRHDDAQRFFSGLELPVAQRERLLEEYDADYVLARAGQARRGRLDDFLDPVHVDRRWVLYRVPGR